MISVKNADSYLGMEYGESVDPDTPSAVLKLHGVMQQHAEQRHDHVGDALLLFVVRVDVGHGEEPVLPHRHLQHRPTTQTGWPLSLNFP